MKIHSKTQNSYSTSKSNKTISLSNVQCKQFVRSPKKYVYDAQKLHKKTKKHHPLHQFYKNRKLILNYRNNNSILDIKGANKKQSKQISLNHTYAPTNYNSACQDNLQVQSICPNTPSNSIGTNHYFRQFQSGYSKKSRIQKTMSLSSHSLYSCNKQKKLIPLKKCNIERKRKKLQQNYSLNYDMIAAQESQHSQPSFSEIYSVQSRIKQKNKTRLQRTMSLKVHKPSVCSTLINYKPQLHLRDKNGTNTDFEKSKNVLDKEWIICVKKYEHNRKQSDKQNSLWRQFQRDRQRRFAEKCRHEQIEYKQLRRKQVKFENMVAKQVNKIRQQKQISKRKCLGFSKYLYSQY